MCAERLNCAALCTDQYGLDISTELVRLPAFARCPLGVAPATASGLLQLFIRLQLADNGYVLKIVKLATACSRTS